MTDQETNDYANLRPHILTGDLIETAQNTGVISPGIRLVTCQRVSHSALVLRLKGYNPEDDLFVLEAWNDGIRIRRLSVLVAQSDHVIWHPLVGVDQAMRDKAAGWMLARLGKEPDGTWGYGWFDAVRAGFGLEPMDESRLICSECIAFAWHHCGVLAALPMSCPVPGQLADLGCTLPLVVVKRHLLQVSGPATFAAVGPGRL